MFRSDQDVSTPMSNQERRAKRNHEKKTPKTSRQKE
jgi:hypothetical protein